MTGDYTDVPLRADDRWTGTRMQAGRVLLDADWNRNLDAAARGLRAVAADAIGPAGVVAGSPAFAVAFSAGGGLVVHAGRMWVGGLLAYAPRDIAYGGQDQIAPLPASGLVLVYLDAFEEHVQPAEAPERLVDPALAPVDTTARTRIGYRVRVAPTTAATCTAAWEGLAPVAGSTGTLSIERVAPAAPADPCAPPGDPLGTLPDGLFRVEVLDPGDAAGARFAWSFENGAGAVAVASVAGDRVTLRQSAAVTFAAGQRVEVSWLARRADRVAHGPLYTIVEPPEGGAGGAILTLDRAVTAPAAADGLAVRRWDGEAVGAPAATAATLGGADLGVRFRVGPGDYVAGDAWCARVREAEGSGIEPRTDAAADGTLHVFAPLALADLGTKQVLADCRPTFVPLSAIDHDSGSCTVTAGPGDDLQAAVDALPAGGGELCLAAGVYPLPAPLRLAGRERVVVTGAGPATVLRATQTEAALLVHGSRQIEIRHLRLEGGDPGKAGDPRLNGALTVVGSTEVTLADCSLSCPESAAGRAQTCVTVRSGDGRDPDAIRIERNRLRVGAWETGILLVDVGSAVVAGNEIGLGGEAGEGVRADGEPLARALRGLVGAAVRTEPGPDTRPLEVPGAAPLHLLRGGPEKLVAALAGRLTASQVARGGALKALQAAARRAAKGPARDRLPKAAEAVVAGLQAELRVVGQGIVVGGSRATTVDIRDNRVESVVQGIHVGVSHADRPGREAADTVLLARNVVHALVPALHDRDRHAVFVGNARSVHVVDTVATLERTGGLLPFLRTPVEGIRIHGELGPFLLVRGSSLSEFRVGVRVVAIGAAPKPRMWVVAETMAAGAAVGVDAPSEVQQERNSP
jgi:hypothetical protein